MNPARVRLTSVRIYWQLEPILGDTLPMEALMLVLLTFCHVVLNISSK